jgi:PAS domain S-box-containing protein
MLLLGSQRTSGQQTAATMKSLFGRFVLIQSLGATVLVLLLQVSLERGFRNGIYSQFVERGQSLARSLATSLEPPLADRRLTDIQAILDASTKISNAEWAYLVGPHGKVWAQTAGSQLPQELLAAECLNGPSYSDLPARKPAKAVTVFCSRVGAGIGAVVYLGFSREGLFVAIQRMELVVLVTIAGVLLAMTLPIAVFLHRWIASPIQTLTHAADHLTVGGALIGAESEHFPEEIRKLAQAFNRIVIEVATQQAALESRVGERTADLESANKKLRDHIAERSRIEQSLEERTTFLNALIENNPLAIVACDTEGRIQLCNPAFEELFQHHQQDVLGAPLDLLVSTNETRSEAQEITRRSLAGETVHVTTQRRRRDGTMLHVEAYGVPLIAHGNRLGGLALYQDITQRKLLEAQLIQAQKLESIGHLAAGIAHEINTPIQYVGDNTAFLRDSFQSLARVLELYTSLQARIRQSGACSELVAEAQKLADEADLEYLCREIPRAIEQSAEGVSRVATIVRAMKEFSHPSGEDMQEIDINHAIQSTLTVSRNEWKYGAEMETDFDAELPMVRCLAGEFNQVILNLVVNAAHAIGDMLKKDGGQKGRITVSTRRDGEWVEIRVKDTGTGIPKAIHSKVFTPFFTTKEVGKGTGQGLALAHSVVVNKHGGTISFETQEGTGTTFVIRIPIKGRPEAN